MVDIDRIRQLIQMMVENDLVELSLRNGDEELSLRRPSVTDPVQVAHGAAGMPSGAGAPAVSLPEPGSGAGTESSQPGSASTDRELKRIVSPMVGTFYTASAPDASPFVEVGAEVNPDTVVCIIEAMKVFNEIKAEMRGTLQEIYVTNEQAVEFGQPLFGLRQR